MPADLRVLARIPLAAVGTWETQVGDGSFDRALLEAIVAASRDPLVRTPRLILGHSVRHATDGVERVPRPAVGHVDNLEVDGDTLYGDLHVPRWLADVAETAVPARSIEAWRNYTTANGDTYAACLTGVALLSDELPAVDTLDDLRNLWARNETAAPDQAGDVAIPVAASRLVACALAPPNVPAPPVGDHPNQEETIVSDPAEVTDPVATPEPEATTVPETPDPAAEPAAEAPAPEVQAQADTVTVDREGYETLRDEVASLRAWREQRDAEEQAAARDELLENAIAAGRIPPSRRDHYSRLYDADPDGARQIVEGLEPGLIPTAPGPIAASRAPEGPASSDFFDEHGELRDEYRLPTPETIARRRAANQ